jgi:hypothetical protein
MGAVYLLLSVLGAVIPYAKFVPWVREHGLDLPLLLWLPIAATCLVGVSCGLPLFLFLRERQKNGEQLRCTA